MSDVYNARYLNDIMQRQEQHFPRSPSNSASQSNASLAYMRYVLLFAEGKFFSNRSDIATMARKLAGYEHDAAARVDDEVAHWELCDIWTMIEVLDGKIPES